MLIINSRKQEELKGKSEQRWKIKARAIRDHASFSLSLSPSLSLSLSPLSLPHPFKRMQMRPTLLNCIIYVDNGGIIITGDSN